jgi:nicotinate-nucleotide adenylyltransferase
MMAEYALKNYNFDKIIFIPAYLPPHKEIQKNLAAHRLEMVKLATKNNPKFEVSDIEYTREEKSYSLLTVNEIIRQNNIDGKLNFIIGTDAFVKLDIWYKAEELKKLVHFIVFPRKGDGNEAIYSDFRKNGWDFEITNMEFVDISSTEIREKHKNYTNEKVEDYIKAHGLYTM